MGTISDKLMRIINTKEDIRQALISKGYDVPTSIPFKEYAKMILDLPCNADSFPDIEGIVARYSASGLTNEQMAANPVWVDKTGNGHDLQMKNFSWKGMSGVGGYGDENHQTFYKFTLDDYVFIATPPGVKHMNFTFRVTGLQPGNKLTLAFFGTTNTVYGTWNKDGIYTVDADIVEAGKPTYFYNGYSATRGEFTIEILPLYPGALVFDGVDDYGACDNFPILTKEKGYTVVALRQWLSFQDIGYPTLVVNSTDRLAAFSFEDFRNETKSIWNWGRSVGLSDYKIPLLYTYQTSTSYNSKTIYAGATEEGSNILQVCRSGFYCANAAIWEIVILDHDATEEELTKIKDYFVKTYPWLFPDQAWTVTGKTNEDEDRATIVNITGNGNDLVLSNFGFAEGSGYGLYGFKFMPKAGVEYYSGSKISFSKHQLDQITLNSYILIFPGESYPREKDITAKIKVAGLKEGVSLTWGWAGNTELTITEDGTYSIKAGIGKLRQLDVVYAEDFDPDHVVTIEQIPEYEGYLVTDGVDDKVVSAESIAFTDTWTIITDAIFLGEKVVSAGILVKDIFGVSNLMEYGRVEVSVKGGVLLKVPTPSIKAICSDGRIYDADWNEYQAEPGTIKVSEGTLIIGMWYNGIQFCSIAFKNLGIYNDQLLSKDYCIKAYNYLQTLKAK